MVLKIKTYPVKYWAYFLFILLSFVLYQNSIVNDYGLDDEFVVTGNPYVQKGTKGIQEIFNSPYIKTTAATLDRRPMVLYTFALEHQAFGNNPNVSHLINILLYALSLIVLFIVLSEVFHLDKEHRFLPFFITVFYAIHPLHTEVVDSLKNRDEILVLLFGMLFLLNAFYYYTKEKRRWWYALLSIVFLEFMLLSKISGITFIGILILVCVFFSVFKGKKWNFLLIIVFLIITDLAIIKLFENFQRTTLFFENPLQDNKDIFIKLGTASKVLLYHLKMLVYPSPLRFYYGYNFFPLTSITNPLALISFLFYVSVFVFGCIRFYKKDILGLVILCYFVSVFLYANFPIPYTGMFSDRALFFSSLWFIVLLSIIVNRVFKSENSIVRNSAFKKIFTTLLFGIFVIYAYMTMHRNFYWYNSFTLMSHDIEYMEKSVVGNYMFANNLRLESKKSLGSPASKDLANKALYYYQQALNIVPDYPEFYFKMANTYRYNLNNLDSAKAYYGYAISIDTLHKDAYYELSKLYFDKNEFNKSYYFFGKTYALQPKDSLTLFYYAQSASNVGEMATCFKINQEFLKLYPELPYPYLNLGTYYSKLLKDDSAVIYLEKAIGLGSRNPGLLKQMSIYYSKKGDNTKAAYFQRLIK